MVGSAERGRVKRSPADGPDQPDLKGDWFNFFLLLMLYTMQGLPLGVSIALPIILQSKYNTSYTDQTFFSFTLWPFSLKLLWAPLVDAIYVQKLGRRKSWLIPVQYLLGSALIYTAVNIDDLLPETGKANVSVLTYVFTTINLLATIQDIIVDGWALTMLKKNNVGYASTCNSAGQTAGIVIGSVLPVLLTSEKFSNEYLRNAPGTGGIATMRSLMYSMGAVFLLTTTLVAIFKKEKDISLEDNYVRLNIIQTYALMWDILKLYTIRILVLALLTMKIGLSTVDVSIIKLVNMGLPKENITIITTIINVINVLIMLITSKFTTGPKLITILLKIYPIRLILNILFAIFIFYTPQWIQFNGIINISAHYYATFIFISLLQYTLMYATNVILMAFFSQKSDPRFGGTYMTLMNTFSNLGYSLGTTISFGIIDFLTFKRSSFDPENKLPALNCEQENIGDCVVDGYYIEIALFTITGIVWYVIFSNILKKLQTRDISQWLVTVKTNSTAENNANSYPMT